VCCILGLMNIVNLSLQNFRSFKKKEIEFNEGVNIILGPNASGKTNILESLYLLSTGKSFKAQLVSEMITSGEEVGRVKGSVSDNELEIVLTDGEIIVGETLVQKSQRKKLLVNDIPKRLIDFAGVLKTVLFDPWDMDLLTGSPSQRRRYLDHAISQIDREYRRAMLVYEKGLRQRNRLLWKIREDLASRNQLLFWDELLIKNGDYINQQRERFIDFLNDSSTVTPYPDTGSIQKKPGSRIKSGMTTDRQYHVVYDKSGISESRLLQYAREEVASATTLVGPHRDDFRVVSKLQITNNKLQINTNSQNLATYGSRGEQRMGILWLKLSEIAFVEQMSGEKPVLLLDDIFSELDHEHRKVVSANLAGFQTIITTADEHYLDELPKGNMIELDDHQIGRK